MDGKYLKENFPKTLARIVKWVKSTHKTSGVPDIDEAVQNITIDAVVAMIVLGSPRFLYDYFDSVEIYVTPYNFLFKAGDNITWVPNINGNDIEKEKSEMKGEIYMCKTREEAEKISFMEAFKIAENG